MAEKSQTRGNQDQEVSAAGKILREEDQHGRKNQKVNAGMDSIEKLRLKSQQRLDQLVRMLDNRDPKAVKESRRILLRIVVDGNPAMLADVLRGMVGRIDLQQEVIDERRKKLNGG